jgi:hypothetical protein
MSVLDFSPTVASGAAEFACRGRAHCIVFEIPFSMFPFSNSFLARIVLCRRFVPRFVDKHHFIYQHSIVFVASAFAVRSRRCQSSLARATRRTAAIDLRWRRARYDR